MTKLHKDRPMFSEYDGSPVKKASDLDYRTTDTCDSCDETFALGTMFHAAGATGRVCPVLFLCDKCNGVKS